MKKILFLCLLFVVNFSYCQSKKKKTKSNKVVTTATVLPLKEENTEPKTNLNSNSDVVISPTGDANLPQEDENSIYNYASVDIKPEFPGGNKNLFPFISKNFQYTDEMKENELKGRIMATFVVEKDGSISDIKIVRSIGYGTENEVLRVLRLMPKWNPGEQNGKKVRCSYVIPIMIYATK